MMHSLVQYIRLIPGQERCVVKAIFNNQLGILDSKFEDHVSIEEIVDYIRATKNNKTHPRTLKILTDATQAIMDFSPDDLMRIVEENNKSLLQYDFIIDGIVINGPRETALSFLYQELAKTDNYKFEIFSTRKTAQEWLEKQ